MEKKTPTVDSSQGHYPDPSLETRGLGPWVGVKAGTLEKSLGNCASVALGQVEQALERSFPGPRKFKVKGGVLRAGLLEGTWPILAPLQRAGLEREEPGPGCN